MEQRGWGRWSLSASLKIQLEIRARALTFSVSLGREGGGTCGWEAWRGRLSPCAAVGAPHRVLHTVSHGALNFSKVCTAARGNHLRAAHLFHAVPNGGRMGAKPRPLALKRDAGVEKRWDL